jgi:Family of unknown function (DUF5654)
MSEDPQVDSTQAQGPQTAEHHRHISIPVGAMDPRKVMDSAAMERVLKAQAAARAQAAASTTVFIGTIVTLISSAFGLVAALSWNTAITAWVNSMATGPLASLRHSALLPFAQAIIVTFIAVVAVVILNRIAGRFAKQNAFNASNNP